MENDIYTQLKEAQEAIKQTKTKIKRAKRVHKQNTDDTYDFDMDDPVESKQYYSALKEKELVQKERNNNRLLQLKLAKANKELIEVKIVTDIVSEVFSKLKTMLYSATNTLPSQIEGKNHAEISNIVYKFIDNTLERFTNDFTVRIATVKTDDDIDDTKEEETEDE